MSESQKQTIARYQVFLDAMAMSACLDSAVKSGVFQTLRSGQRTLEELAASCHIQPQALEHLIRVLAAVGAVEIYGEFIALSQAISLIAPVDADLGHKLWQHLPAYLTPQEPTNFTSAVSLDVYRRRISSRQWTHTAAAVQASEALGFGSALRGLNILELGSGAGVWSAAMIYRDPTARLTVVDHASMLGQCQATFASVELLDRVTMIEDDYRTWSTPLGEFDLVILPEIVQLEQDPSAVILLGRAADALRVGGRAVILETLYEPDGPSLPLATQALEIALATAGCQRTVAEMQRLLIGAGFGDAQWGWLDASPHGIGLVIASKV